MSAPLGPEVAEARDLHLQSTQNNTSTPTLIEGSGHATPKAGTLEEKPARNASILSKRLSQSSRLDEEIATPTLHEKPKGAKFGLIILSLYLATYLFCLDISIVSPALPKITNDFGSTSEAVWFFSIYLAINTAFQPLFAPWFKLTPKYTFLICVFLFLIGSLICAVAPNSNTFIGGRALAGVGSSGGYIGVMSIIAVICEPHEVAQWSNGVGAMYSLGAVSGPLIGGAFTTHVTWRWCFYINLPICGITLLTCFFCLPDTDKKDFRLNLKRAFWSTDFVGLALVLGALIELLMVFQWGGLKYDWSNSIIIGLIVGFCLTVIALGGWIWFRNEKAYLRPRILKLRTVWVAMFLNFGIAAAYFTIISLLAYYYQIRGSSAIRSGVQLLPLIAGVIFGLVIGGIGIPKIGYVNPLLIFGNIVFAIGVGCFVLFDVNTSTAFWAGISFMAGAGSGISFMSPFIQAQAYFAKNAPGDLEVATTHVLFPQTLGGAIVFGIGQTIYQNKYAHNILNIQGLPNPAAIAEGGITAFYQLAPAEFIPQIRQVAINALRDAYYPGLACLCLTSIIFLPLLPWNSVKDDAPKKAEDPEKGSHVAA